MQPPCTLSRPLWFPVVLLLLAVLTIGTAAALQWQFDQGCGYDCPPKGDVIAR